VYQILIYSKQRKTELIFRENILRELKSILAELFSTGEIDRIDEIK
jgi:hypothetical protein